MQHRPLEIPPGRQKFTHARSYMIHCRGCVCLSVEDWSYSRTDGSKARIPGQNWAKIGRHKGAHHGCFGSTDAHFMSKY